MQADFAAEIAEQRSTDIDPGPNKSSNRRIRGGSIPIKRPEIAEEFVGFYESWDRFEFSRNPEFKIIETNVSEIVPRKKREFKDREEIRSALRELEASLRVEALGLPSCDPIRIRYDQLRSSEYFLTEQSYRLNLPELALNTIGVGLEFFDEDKEIRPLREKLKEALVNAGYPAADLRAGFDDYREQNRLDNDTLVKGLLGIVTSRGQRVWNYLNLPDSQELGLGEGLIELINDPDAPYRMDAHYRSGRPQLVVNIGRTYFKGDEEYFAHHEIFGHIFDHEVLRIKIRKGEIMPELGLLTYHDQQNYPREGIALTLPDFLPPELLGISPEGDISYAWRNVRDAVMNNAQLKVSSPPGSVEDNLPEAVRYALNQMGILSAGEIDALFRARFGDPLGRFQPFVYGIARKKFAGIAERLGTQSKKQVFLSNCYGTPLSSEGVNRIEAAAAA